MLPSMSTVIEMCDHKPEWIGRVALSACAKCGMILGPWNVHTCGACHAVLYCGAECQEVC